MEYTFQFIKDTLKQNITRQTANISSTFSSISIDSRQIKAGAVFIAIKGEIQDGHDYIESAFNNGATLAIVNENFKLGKKNNNQNFLFVDDTMKAFHLLAAKHLQLMPATRVALTGSNGKTTTKEMMRCMLAEVLPNQNFSVNTKSFNNNFGVPLSALQVTELDKIAVFEMGMNHAGEITELCQIINPHIALITNIGLAHSGFLGGIKGVAAAKGELFRYISAKDIAIVNIDDENCIEQSCNFLGKKITFGQNKSADIYLKAASPNWNKNHSNDLKSLGMDIVLIYKQKQFTSFLPLLGIHNALNAAAAFAVMTQLNINLEQAILGLNNMQAVYGRLRPLQMPNGSIALDDSYNASPDSLKAAIKLLASFPGRRKVAVLGEMTEQNDNSQIFHQSTGALCNEYNIDLLFTFGENAQAYIDGAIQAGMPKSKCFWAPNQKELAQRLASTTKSNDIILFKGSRFSQTEKVLENLTFLQQKE